jgi:hypothetical protein
MERAELSLDEWVAKYAVDDPEKLAADYMRQARELGMIQE